MVDKTSLKTWVVVAVVSSVLVPAIAAAVEWTGGGTDDSWCTPENWAGAAVPSASDDAVIDVPGDPNAEIEPACSATCNRLTVGQTASDCRLDIIGGNLAVTTDLVIGDSNYSNGTVTVTGGTVDVGGLLDIGRNAHVQLDGGTVSVGELFMYPIDPSMDITGGTLIIDGYALDDVWDYMDAGYLTGYGSVMFLVVDYDVRNAGKTTVTAISTLDYAWWSGGAAESNSWCEPNNWEPAVVPGASDDAVIDVPGDPNAEIEPDCNAMCNMLTVGQSRDNCRLDIIGGSLAVITDFVIGSTAHVQLDGGTFNAGELIMNTNASMDITGGTLIIDGYALDDVWGYAEAGYLTGYSSPATLVVDYDVRNTGKTTVTATCTWDCACYCLEACQAWNPRPFDNETLVDLNVTLSWSPGIAVGLRGRHLVYFSTDETAVEDAGPGDPENVAILNNIGQISYNIGTLPLWTTFYWRVDELNEAGPTTKGKLWTFTTRPIFVDWSASGANDGTSWTDAYKYLQDALADPCLALTGGVISVAEGTYEPDESNAVPGGTGLRTDTFALISGVAIYGGFPSGGGDWGDRDPDFYETVLSGDLNEDDVGFTNNGENSYHVITGSGTDPNAVIDGFTITAGNATGASWPHNQAGGMLNQNECSHRVSNCMFIGNQAVQGGAMCNELSSPTVANCMFSGNVASSSVGGMYNSNSAPNVINCVFSGNTGNYGAGMGNVASSSPTVSNCTFSGNTARNQGGGIYNNTSNPTLRNCILWGNTDSGATDESAQMSSFNSTPVINYSCVLGWTGALGGTGNIGDDPLFKDTNGPDDIVGTEDDNLQLRHDSPCIDAGDNNSVPADATDLDGDGDTSERTPLDLAGNARFTDDPVAIDTGNPAAGYPEIVEMGAYERYEFCGDAEHPPPPGDVSGPTGVPDCRINFFDFAVWMIHWLEDTGPE